MADAPVAALTGATGFLGRHLVQALAADGWRLRVLVRSFAQHEQLAPHRLELVPGDVHDQAALARLCTGAQAIIHMAGAIKGDARALMKINGAGTQNMVEAWQKNAPGARFVLVSSLTAREPHLSAYGASKQAAEAVLADQDGRWLIARPAAIYGPWDRETLSIFKAASWPVQPMLNGANARLALIHVKDAAAALCALADGVQERQVFELGDAAPKGYAWPEIIDAACRATGRRARPLALMPGLVRAAAALNGAAARLRGQVSIFDTGKAREILHPDWTIQAKRRVPASLWSPEISIGEGFAQTVRWYRAQGWL